MALRVNIFMVGSRQLLDHVVVMLSHGQIESIGPHIANCVLRIVAIILVVFVRRCIGELLSAVDVGTFGVSRSAEVVPMSQNV